MAYGKKNSYLDWCKTKGNELVDNLLAYQARDLAAFNADPKKWIERKTDMLVSTLMMGGGIGVGKVAPVIRASRFLPFLVKTGKRAAIGAGGLGVSGLGYWGIKSIYNRLNPDPGLYAESTDKGVRYYQITQGGNKVPVDPQSGRWQVRGNDLMQIAPDGTVMESINTAPAVSAFGGGVLRPFYENNSQFVADSTRKADSVKTIQKADSSQRVIDSLRMQNDSLQKQNQLQKEMPSIWNFKKLDSETDAVPYWKRELDRYGVFA